MLFSFNFLIVIPYYNPSFRIQPLSYIFLKLMGNLILLTIKYAVRVYQIDGMGII